VDMAAGFINDPKAAGTMTYDHVHPNNKGQLFMMEKWYSAILQNLNDREPPLLRGKPVITERRDSATVSWTAGDDNYGIKSYQIFVNGKRVKTTNQTTFTYRLAAIRNSRPFKVSVRAADWSGNYSKLIWAEAKPKR
ncbi:MAG TPA: hypothetical protein VEY06_05540, partial [Flavisolibacter sp.]|nr:hypothetical protein [Flavisolibacter sp.]